MNKLYRRRRDLVCDALHEIGIPVRPPRGTIYMWAPVPEGFASSAAYCEHVLEQADVVMSPGSIYGPAGEGWFRISLTTPDKRLLEAVERLGALGVDFFGETRGRRSSRCFTGHNTLRCIDGPRLVGDGSRP